MLVGVSIRVSSAFDGGNGDRVAADGPDDVRVRIRKDVGGRFMQWFYFRVTGHGRAPLTVRIVNAHEGSYRAGYEGYRAVASTDRKQWVRVPTEYDGTNLVIRHPGGDDAVWLAYFAPFSMERHADLIARCQRQPGVTLESLGHTLDGQDLDLLRFGEGPLQAWVIARQHPGETMAEHWMEGFLARMLDDTDPVARRLREAATFHVVPNMNPDGSRRGHLRTNAAGENLNRAWMEPSMETSPEVFLVRQRMEQTGVGFCLDVHGDEELPYNFIAGADGIPSLTPRQASWLEEYRGALERISPDFQTKHGYAPTAPGQANLRLCTNWVAERFGGLAMTLEQPFKDASNHPDPVYGWSPARCQNLAADCVAALWAVLPELLPAGDAPG